MKDIVSTLSSPESRFHGAVSSQDLYSGNNQMYCRIAKSQPAALAFSQGPRPLVMEGADTQSFVLAIIRHPFLPTLRYGGRDDQRFLLMSFVRLFSPCIFVAKETQN